MDAILSSRGGESGSEHEASRRMKTELLMQMDGLRGSNKLHEQVFVMAASNLPWDLDVAMLRRSFLPFFLACLIHLTHLTFN